MKFKSDVISEITTKPWTATGVRVLSNNEINKNRIRHTDDRNGTVRKGRKGSFEKLSALRGIDIIGESNVPTTLALG